ncbi:lytic polysaccharide monooxygenase [Dothidotthia symphoricarpi CBS 119687]|uniref:Lytic polysaccharide monooxygenase n=1 Tax=Dothidotthia symphoricarpi CBS 119687 TaxID=1392245 RepID=A0A6A6A3X9_9PLEO|nr:lytic polysaccharide monooxygenase [Dothidotthia symphoricarpi CBS 119687]KAF2125448.1 lytic polysaccharide monooxygenase [Dothidotthia symphoricarpi CBS 119687]
MYSDHDQSWVLVVPAPGSLQWSAYRHTLLRESIELYILVSRIWFVSHHTLTTAHFPSFLLYSYFAFQYFACGRYHTPSNRCALILSRKLAEFDRKSSWYINFLDQHDPAVFRYPQSFYRLAGLTISQTPDTQIHHTFSTTKMFSQAAALLAFIATASAHMTILNPVPFGNSTLNSSPLELADFPCKQRSGVYDITEMNQWNAGETQTISFRGSAVHGGGSCQFSITTDAEPTLQSQWKVIESVIGGCPSNVSGNLPTNEDGRLAATFPVTMPSTIPDGRYTFAWTWLNKVGNREFYMNCAPIQVGSSDSASTASAASALSAFPDMFVANIPATSCSTSENQDFNYPNPGQNVIEGVGAALGDTLTGAGCTAMTAMGAGSGEIGTPSQGSSSQAQSSDASVATSAAVASSAPIASSAPDASSAAVASSAPAMSAVQSNPGVYAPGAASSAPATQPSSTAAAPSAVSSEAPSYPVASSAPATQPSTTAAAAQPVATEQPTSDGDCTPCTDDGAVVCIGSSQFGLCNRGCVVAQDLAAGMSCTNGVVVGSARKRNVNFPRAHLHRRHGSRFF